MVRYECEINRRSDGLVVFRGSTETAFGLIKTLGTVEYDIKRVRVFDPSWLMMGVAVLAIVWTANIVAGA